MAKLEITICSTDDNGTAEAVLAAFHVEGLSPRWQGENGEDAMVKAIEAVLNQRLTNRGMKLIPINDTRS